MASAVVIGFAAAACGGGSDHALEGVDETEVFDRLVEGVAGSDQVFHVTQLFERVEPPFVGGTTLPIEEIWLSAGGTTARSVTERDGQAYAAVYADDASHHYNLGDVFELPLIPKGAFDESGLYALRYLAELSRFENLTWRTSRLNGEEALEITGDRGFTDSSDRECRDEARLYVVPDSLFPLQLGSHTVCGDRIEEEKLFLYTEPGFVDHDSLPGDWFEAKNLREQVLNSQIEKAKAVGFSVYIPDPTGSSGAALRHLWLRGEEDGFESTGVEMHLVPPDEADKPFIDLPYLLAMHQRAADDSDFDLCPDARDIVALEDGATAVMCVGPTRTIFFQKGSTEIAIFTTELGALGPNPYDDDDALIAIANSLVPVP